MQSWNLDYNKKKEANIETAKMKFFRSVAGYVRENQIKIQNLGRAEHL